MLKEKVAMLSVDAVEPVIRKMPPALQRQVLKYIEMISARAEEKRHGTMKFAWAGCCADINGDYTSVQLQKKIPDWWK
ncbi:DUF2281 domain-containing protein [Methanoregula sp.]|uniref:DUF2281 domain-containing protein n=1 Tax=Methanoregula sp. TaxID=2052170 RepID=UPI0035670974